MESSIYSVITGTGSYIPPKRVTNDDFITNTFYGSNGIPLADGNHSIVEKFLDITTIEERRYVNEELSTSEMAFHASLRAIESAGIDKEELDYIIVAHNFGEVTASGYVDTVPSVAARLKHKLQIKNPDAVAYDLIFGCPGWVQALIQANYYIKSGDASKILVVGADVLSRVSDPHDRDSMIYADGAGAVVVEAKRSATPIGIVAHKTRTDSFIYSGMLTMGASYNPDLAAEQGIYIKMNGRRLYQYALDTVAPAIKYCLEKSGTCIDDVKKIFIHQANGKMDDAILKRLYDLYGIDEAPVEVMPMTIAKLGNSSVATIPTLLDFVLREKMNGHRIGQNDTIVFASVGAGMSINAVVYKM